MVKVLTLLNAALFLVSTALLVMMLTGTLKTTSSAEEQPIIYRPSLMLLI